jgi:hypothetical protein
MRTCVLNGLVYAVGAFCGLAFARPVHAQQACDVHCGTERWTVKTLIDRDTARIDTAAVTSTVSQLRALAVPDSLPPNSRVAPVELTTYQVDAVLVGWKLEADEDIHLVLASPQDSTQTMIAEVPSPTCPEVCNTTRAPLWAALRQQLIDRLGSPSRRFHQYHPGIPVRVSGVGFFDFIHGQTGVAPNGIELHPVMAVVFQ